MYARPYVYVSLRGPEVRASVVSRILVGYEIHFVVIINNVPCVTVIFIILYSESDSVSLIKNIMAMQIHCRKRFIW